MSNHGHDVRDDDYDHEGHVNLVKDGVDSSRVDIDIRLSLRAEYRGAVTKYELRSKCHKNVFEKLTAIMPNRDYLI